jgi:hypothetical protein
MDTKFLDRIIRESGCPDVMRALIERLSPSDLQSLLMEVFRQRVEGLTPRDLMERYKNSRFVQPSPVAPEQMLEFDRLAWSLLPPDFDRLELAPVFPLGSHAVLGPLNQNRVVTAIRNIEAAADATTGLALECACRRRMISRASRGRQEILKLAASQRQLRAQTFDEPGAFAHFRIFALCTAGRDSGGFRFETTALREHLDYYLRLLNDVRALGLKPAGLRVVVLLFGDHGDKIDQGLIGPLSSRFPQTRFEIEADASNGRHYYQDVRFQVYAEDPGGNELLLVDGGFTAWTQKLLSNRKERLLTSGIGSERLCACFLA